MGIALDIFWVFAVFLGFDSFFGYGVFANQPTVHSGGLSRGGSVAVAVGFIVTGDRRHKTCDMYCMTHDKRHLTHDTFSLSVSFCPFLVSRLILAQEIQCCIYEVSF